MSMNRYEINQYFHLNDSSKAIPKSHPGYDALHKVRPLLDSVLNNSQAHYYPDQDISIDEATIKFKGRLSFNQYIKNWVIAGGTREDCVSDVPCGTHCQGTLAQGQGKASAG
ncbi:hypothetical protein ACOMHN_038388 [Nucella lapillus]